MEVANSKSDRLDMWLKFHDYYVEYNYRHYQVIRSDVGRGREVMKDQRLYQYCQLPEYRYITRRDLEGDYGFARNELVFYAQEHNWNGLELTFRSQEEAPLLATEQLVRRCIESLYQDPPQIRVSRARCYYNGIALDRYLIVFKYSRDLVMVLYDLTTKDPLWRLWALQPTFAGIPFNFEPYGLQSKYEKDVYKTRYGYRIPLTAIQLEYRLSLCPGDSFVYFLQDTLPPDSLQTTYAGTYLATSTLRRYYDEGALSSEDKFHSKDYYTIVVSNNKQTIAIVPDHGANTIMSPPIRNQSQADQITQQNLEFRTWEAAQKEAIRAVCKPDRYREPGTQLLHLEHVILGDIRETDRDPLINQEYEVCRKFADSSIIARSFVHPPDVYQSQVARRSDYHFTMRGCKLDRGLHNSLKPVISYQGTRPLFPMQFTPRPIQSALQREVQTYAPDMRMPPISDSQGPAQSKEAVQSTKESGQSSKEGHDLQNEAVYKEKVIYTVPGKEPAKPNPPYRLNFNETNPTSSSVEVVSLTSTPENQKKPEPLALPKPEPKPMQIDPQPQFSSQILAEDLKKLIVPIIKEEIAPLKAAVAAPALAVEIEKAMPAFNKQLKDFETAMEVIMTQIVTPAINQNAVDKNIAERKAREATDELGEKMRKRIREDMKNEGLLSETTSQPTTLDSRLDTRLKIMSTDLQNINSKVFDLTTWLKSANIFDTDEFQSKIEEFDERVGGLTQSNRNNLKTWNQVVQLMDHFNHEQGKWQMLFKEFEGHYNRMSSALETAHERESSTQDQFEGNLAELQVNMDAIKRSIENMDLPYQVDGQISWYDQLMTNLQTIRERIVGTQATTLPVVEAAEGTVQAPPIDYPASSQEHNMLVTKQDLSGLLKVGDLNHLARKSQLDGAIAEIRQILSAELRTLQETFTLEDPTKDPPVSGSQYESPRQPDTLHTCLRRQEQRLVNVSEVISNVAEGLKVVHLTSEGSMKPQSLRQQQSEVENRRQDSPSSEDQPVASSKRQRGTSKERQ